MIKKSMNDHFEYFQAILAGLKNPTTDEVTKLWESFVTGKVPKTNVGLSAGKMKTIKLTQKDTDAGIVASYSKKATDSKRGEYFIRYDIIEDKVKKVKTFKISPKTPTNTLDSTGKKYLQQDELPYTLTVALDNKQRNIRPRVFRGANEVVPVEPKLKAAGVKPAPAPTPTPTPTPTPKTKKKTKTPKVKPAKDPNKPKKNGWKYAIAVAVGLALGAAIMFGAKSCKNEQINPEPTPGTDTRPPVVSVMPGDDYVKDENPNIDVSDTIIDFIDKDYIGENEDQFAEDKKDPQPDSNGQVDSDKSFTEASKDAPAEETTTPADKKNDHGRPENGLLDTNGSVEQEDSQGFDELTK